MDFMHPVFQIKVGMTPSEVKALLGDPFTGMGIDQIVPYLNEQGVRANRADEDQPDVAWVYADNDHEISCNFRFGSLASAMVVKKDESGALVFVARIDDERGLTLNRDCWNDKEASRIFFIREMIYRE
ncbi:hypothetical protein [Catenulispora pinisilvae]|uniref:hypothetical protein n=1 Tax=Catenulispora pinisilvae TaxID=2705253 RepID=UPI001891B2D6|nr:hypothetical protein [Catenulispora pinisilvae]